jgi:hypothetical protein
MGWFALGASWVVARLFLEARTSRVMEFVEIAALGTADAANAPVGAPDRHAPAKRPAVATRLSHNRTTEDCPQPTAGIVDRRMQGVN